MLDILARLNISRCAPCGQAEHLKMCRSIPHTVAVSVSTCIRRIPAPHATHFITPPDTKRAHGMHWPVALSSGCSGLRRDVAEAPRTATKSGRFAPLAAASALGVRTTGPAATSDGLHARDAGTRAFAHSFCIGRLA